MKIDLEEILERKNYYLSKRFFLDNKLKLIAVFIIILLFCTAFVYTKNKSSKNIENKIFSKTDIKDDSKGEDEEFIIIDINGSVESAGVYELPKHSRIDDAIKAGGGLTQDADISNINRASLLEDGQKVYIPKKGETSKENLTHETVSKDSKLINLNTATSDELRQVTGIGPAMAEKIILYRGEHGGFKSIEDLKNIDGIGDKTFDKYKKFFKI